MNLTRRAEAGHVLAEVFVLKVFVQYIPKNSDDGSNVLHFGEDGSGS
jgi:hypothetical protein